MTDTLWIALLIAITMIATRLTKLWPRAPKGLIPLVAVAIGAGAYLAYAHYVLGQALGDAWQSWLVVLVGAGAVVGHDLLKPALVALIGEPWAIIILGRIRKTEPKPPTKPPGVAIGGIVLALAMMPVE